MHSLLPLQKALLAVSILTLLVLPSAFAFYPTLFSTSTVALLYAVSHLAVFFTMAIRPLADLLPRFPTLRPLIFLRQGFGVLSASIPLSFLFAKIIIDPFAFFASFGTLAYWSLTHLALLAHLADISALLLVLTSNTASKRLLRGWWKRIQRLSYVYFYASMLYVWLVVGHTELIVPLVVVSVLTFGAFFKKRLVSGRIA